MLLQMQAPASSSFSVEPAGGTFELDQARLAQMLREPFEV
jgi:hypothetical protein